MFETPIFDGTGEWYSRVIVGYVVTASLVATGLTAAMSVGVV
ncbi:hypothetical protein [Halopiger goleimassiliensis]|nr:hypothetical protein [Halopiger goleimassiliensis]